MILRNILIIKFVLILFSNSLFAQNAIIPRKTKQEKGYFSILEMGYFLGTSYLSDPNNDRSSPLNVRSLRTVNGIFLNPNLSLGIGIGVDGNDTNRFGFFNTFLVYADARYYLKNNVDGWFLYSDLGSAVKIDNSFEKGLFLNMGGGYKFNVGKVILVPSLGYNQQNFGIYNTDYRNSSLALKIGFMF